MISIVDYGAGNLYSLQNALKVLSKKSLVTRDEKEIDSSRAIILPGVGAFPDAMGMLKEFGLDEIIISQAKKGKPLLGICLGMQFLFGESEEIKKTKGLSLIPGKVRLIRGAKKLPHMGWNSLIFDAPSPLFKGIESGEYVYFVHSYMGEVDKIENLAAHCHYFEDVCAAVASDNVFGVQFHPEKSSRAGLKILENFCSYAGE